MIIQKILLCVILVSLSSCSGYIISYNQNPFERYGIKSVSIPMFYNHSSISKVSGDFTREVYAKFSKYQGLRVYSGNNPKADAVLIGILSSSDQYKDVFKTTTRVFTDGELEKSIANRNKFYVPTGISYKLFLRIILIKNPDKNIVSLAKSSLGKYLKNNSKVIFNEKIALTGSFASEAKETLTPDSPGVVNMTQSRKNFEKSIAALAISAATAIEETVFNVF